MSRRKKLSMDEVRAIVVEEFMKIRGTQATKFDAQLAIHNRLGDAGMQTAAEVLNIYYSMSMEDDKRGVTVNLHNSTAGNIVFDSEVNSITASVNSVSQKGGAGAAFGDALKQLTDAVRQTGELDDAAKKGVLEALDYVGKQADEKPETRKPTILSSVLDSLPKLLGSAASLTTLWHNLGPHIVNFFK